MLTGSAAKPSGEHTLFHVNGPPRVPTMTRKPAQCAAIELRFR